MRQYAFDLSVRLCVRATCMRPGQVCHGYGDPHGYGYGVGMGYGDRNFVPTAALVLARRRHSPASLLSTSSLLMYACLARKMRVQHNHSRNLLDDGMSAAGCYRYHARGTHDLVWRHGLATNLQKLLKGKS